MTAVEPRKPSPQQRFARKFWCDFASGDLVAHFFLSSSIALRRGSRAGHEADLMSKLDELLSNLGYSTTMQCLLDELEASHAELAFWSGSYALYGDSGARYELHVTDKVLVSGVGMRLTEASFDDGTLRVGDADRGFSLSFTLPATAKGVTIDDRNLDKVLRSCQPRCSGTLTTRLADGSTVTRPIEGKRGCYTRAGVRREEDGDPPAFWRGVYGVVYPDDQGVWRQSSDQLVLGGTDAEPTVTLAGKPGTEVMTGNNGLVFSIGDEGERFAGMLIMNADGSKWLNGLIRSDNGAMRPLHGFWTDEVPRHAVPAPHPRVRRAMLGDAPPDPAADFVVDVTKLDAAVPLNLPRGVERNPYRVRLLVKSPTQTGSAAELARASWSIDAVNPADVPFPLDIQAAEDVVDKEGGRFLAAVIEATWGETQHALLYKFDITAVIVEPAIAATPGKAAKAAETKTTKINARLLIDSRANMDITPEELTTIPSGQSWSAALAASGGMPPYTWTRDERLLPAGITFVNGVFSGTTKASQQTFSTVVTVSSDPQKIKMAVTSRSYSLVVVEPEQVGGIQAGWVVFALSVLGSLLGAGVFLYKRYKETDDPLEKQYEAEAEKTLGEKYVTSVKADMREAFRNPVNVTADQAAKAKIDQICQDALNDLATARNTMDAVQQKIDGASEYDPRLLEWKRELRDKKQEWERQRDRLDSSERLRDRWDRKVDATKAAAERIKDAKRFFE